MGRRHDHLVCLLARGAGPRPRLEDPPVVDRHHLDELRRIRLATLEQAAGPPESP